MDGSTAPILVGVLHDYPIGDPVAGFETAARVGIDRVGSRLDRPIELRHAAATGLPRGSAHAVATAFGELVDAGVVLVLGPAVTDNALVTRDLADAARVPCINYTGSEETRSEWSFQYQIGSLEEEPGLLARHLASEGHARVAVVHDRSTIGRRYVGAFERAAEGAGVELVGRAGVSPLADDLTAEVRSLRASEPEALVYLGLGLSAHPVAAALAGARWRPPVVANSALMHGYASADWAREWDGWTYCDAVSASNPLLTDVHEALGAPIPGPGPSGQHDLGRLAAEAAARADNLTRVGLREGLERIKMLPAAMGRAGTTMGFGVWDRAALKGEYLVLRQWQDGVSVELDAG